MPTVANDPITEFKLQTLFKAAKGFCRACASGRCINFRARAVDLAGNSIAPDALLDDIYNCASGDPLPALRTSRRAGAGPPPETRSLNSPGESLERIVIRQQLRYAYRQPSRSAISRHPKTSAEMAETHACSTSLSFPPPPI